MREKLSKVVGWLLAHTRGRKFAAFLVVVTALLVSGWTIAPDKVTPVTIALTASLTTFCASHAYTDRQAAKNDEVK